MRKESILLIWFAIHFSCLFGQTKWIQRQLLPSYTNTFAPSSSIFNDGLVQAYKVYSASIAVPNCIMLLDSNTQMVWEKSIYVDGNNDNQYANINDIIASDADHIYPLLFKPLDGYIIPRIDNNGNVAWAKQPSLGSTNLYIWQMAAKDDYLVLVLTEGMGNSDRFIVKLDHDGNVIWQKRYFTNTSSINISNIEIDPNDNIYLYGIEDFAFFNMMILPDGNLGYSNRHNDGGSLGTTYAYNGIPIGNKKSLITGLFTPVGGPNTWFWGVSDTNGVVSSLQIFSDSTDNYNITSLSNTIDNTILLTADRTDSLYTTLLLYEVNENGSLIEAKQRTGDSLIFGSNGILSNNQILTTYQFNNSGYIFSTPRGADICRPYQTISPQIINYDISSFTIEHNIQVDSSNINFTNRNVSLAPISTTQLIELCVLGLGVQENTIEFKLYPNPSGNYVQLNVETPIDQLELLDLTGKTLKTILYPSQDQLLPVNDLSPGIYLIKLSHGSNTSIQKFIKQ